MEPAIKKALEDLKINLKSSCNNESFWNDFIRTLQINKIENNTVVLVAKNAFAKQILENEYLSIFESFLGKSLGSKLFVSFQVNNQKQPNAPLSLASPTQNNVNKNLVFENFVVGSFNKLAYNAAQSVFKDNYWNPIFINGGVGLGKTHLLHAIGNKLLRLCPQKKIKYITSDEFVRVTYSNLTNNTIESLKDEYESYDLLLFDDVQFLSNKEKINEIFFNIFNNNLSKNKIIVLASDKEPNELPYFDNRMKSRFASGLLIKITKPDLSSLKTILENKIKDSNDSFSFTNEAVDYVARRGGGDVRKLEGVLHQVLFYAFSFLPPKSVISLETIKQIFSFTSAVDLKNNNFELDPEIVIKQVCAAYQVSEDKVKSEIRVKNISLIRQVCMFVLKTKIPSITLNQIGGYFGGRNHSTVVESLEKIKKLAEKDGLFNSFLQNLINKI